MASACQENDKSTPVRKKINKAKRIKDTNIFLKKLHIIVAQIKVPSQLAHRKLSSLHYKR